MDTQNEWVTPCPVVVDIRIKGDVELPVTWEVAKHLSGAHLD
jgi:hypothetical protein